MSVLHIQIAWHIFKGFEIKNILLCTTTYKYCTESILKNKSAELLLNHTVLSQHTIFLIGV